MASLNAPRTYEAVMSCVGVCPPSFSITTAFTLSRVHASRKEPTPPCAAAGVATVTWSSYRPRTCSSVPYARGARSSAASSSSGRTRGCTNASDSPSSPSVRSYPCGLKHRFQPCARGPRSGLTISPSRSPSKTSTCLPSAVYPTSAWKRAERPACARANARSSDAASRCTTCTRPSAPCSSSTAISTAHGAPSCAWQCRASAVATSTARTEPSASAAGKRSSSGALYSDGTTRSAYSASTRAVSSHLARWAPPMTNSTSGAVPVVDDGARVAAGALTLTREGTELSVRSSSATCHAGAKGTVSPGSGAYPSPSSTRAHVPDSALTHAQAVSGMWAVLLAAAGGSASTPARQRA
mmetsp:Transcript_8265/g.21344  ORF Transcript_8265/g.21344 Transcript_8265/m.21344 type:complete len:354 (-) Transcript_8265:693-1754(-)